MAHLPNAKVIYSANGNDPRNYKVSFKKVKETLGFEPEYSVKDGVKELIEALDLGLYNDFTVNKNKYGNYNINY
jgi:nucleoside-diphosphate-sugar epimerase